MDWLSRLNNALDYMEENMTGEIDYDKAAQMTCCSTYHFQKMFSFIAGVPLSEYIRRRRMTLAAFDLQNGCKVLDTALRYGYGSPTSFNRAFQSVHGVAPSVAQKENVALKAYPRISFQISIKGDVEMDYRIVNQKDIRVVGISVPIEHDMEKNFATIPAMWGKAAQEGIIDKALCPIMDTEFKGILGISVCMKNQEQWEYYIAVASTQPVPQGLKEFIIPGGTWAVFPGTGPMPTAIQEVEKRVVTEWLPSSSYEYADRPDIEVYLNADPVNSQFEAWVPVVRKESEA